MTALAVIALVIVYSLNWRGEEARHRQLLIRGEQALAARDYATAREHLNVYLEFQPQDNRARLLAARAARKLHNYDEAAAELDRCRASGGDPEAIELEATLIAVEQGDVAPVPYLRARVAEREDELSLVILEVLIQHDLELYRLRDAMQGFNLYLARRPDDLYALLGRGMVWERLLSFADAVVDYRRAVRAHPASDRARRRLATALLVVGTPAEALEHYQWLADAFPGDASVRLGLAKCHRQLNRPQEARALLDELLASAMDQLKSTPAYAEVLWERGRLEMDRGRPGEAEPWLRLADTAAPFDRRIAFSLFSCLVALERTDEAESIKRRIARIEEDLRRLDEIRQLVMIRPRDADLRLEGANIFLRNGERDEAIRWLEMALRFNPARADVQATLAAARQSL